MNNRQHAILAEVFCLFCYASPLAMATGIDWMQQTDKEAYTQYHTVSAIEAGSVYVSGYTGAGLDGPNAGLGDAVLRKYDTEGNIVWTRQIGSVDDDYAYGVSADGNGSVYLSGDTRGEIGSLSAGKTDVFLSKFGSSGNLQWKRQIGSSGGDLGTLVSADSLGNVFVSGYTDGDLGGTNAGRSDAFLAKFDGLGNHLWTRQLGTNEVDACDDLSVDGLGNVYITGSTAGSLVELNAGSFDVFVSKYNAEGNHIWTRQLGSPFSENSIGVSADVLGNVYITGFTEGSLSGESVGGGDAFLGKYNADGDLLWVKQFGSKLGDAAYRVAADLLGNVFVTGQTSGDWGGPVPERVDTFVSKFDSDGQYIWTQRLALDPSIGLGASVDGTGNVYVSGNHESRAFLAKLSDPTLIPEPNSLLLALGIVSCCYIPRGSRSCGT